MEMRANVGQLNQEIQKKIEDNYTSRNCKNTGMIFVCICRLVYVFLSYGEIGR